MMEEEVLVLQHQYGHLCAEKCRLLSAIEHNNREGRSLQKQVQYDPVSRVFTLTELYRPSRLMDLLLETVPEKRIEDMIDESDSEAFEECEWLDEEDDHLSNSQRSYLHERLGEIKEALQTVSSQSIAIKRRRSTSPDRRSKPRRNYKVLPLSEEGEVELPLVLGRGTNRTIVTSIGYVEDTPHFRHEKYVFPVGFESKRKYFSPPDEGTDLNKPRKSYYFCLIRKFGDRPKFEIYNCSLTHVAPEMALDTTSCSLICADTDLPKLWDDFKSKFTSEQRRQLDIDFPHPEAFIGLEHDNLLKYLSDQLAEIK